MGMLSEHMEYISNLSEKEWNVYPIQQKTTSNSSGKYNSYISNPLQ